MAAITILYWTSSPQGVDVYELAAKPQDEGAKSFVSSWNDLMNVIASKNSKLAKAS
jgi:transaldolase